MILTPSSGPVALDFRVLKHDIPASQIRALT